MPVTLQWAGKNSAFALATDDSSPSDYTYLESNEKIDNNLLHRPGNYCFISDNLQALRFFQNEKVGFQFIYIDPPYNTGQDFTYEDSFLSEDSWLDMITPRLICAKQLLTDEGVIFVSIDDRQIASLTILMYEIFGKSNQIGTIKWKKKRKPSFLDKHFSSTIEYILVFAKNKGHCKKLLGEVTQDGTRPVLNASNKISERMLKAGTIAHCKDGLYKKGVFRNRTLEVEFMGDWEVKKHLLVNDVLVRGRFRVSQDVIEKCAFLTKNIGLRRRVLDGEKKHKHACDDLTGIETNEDAETEIRNIFGGKIFDYPKPTGLIYKLLSMCQFSTKDVRCLDFFAGSGTLAEAVLRFNSENKTSYQFFVIQNADKIAIKKADKEMRFASVAEILIFRVKHCLKKFNPEIPTYFLKNMDKF